MTLPERILKLAEFDENEYEREAKRYTFTHENAHRDHEHLSDEQVKSALQHLAKFENLRLLPIIKSLALIIEKQSEALELLDKQFKNLRDLQYKGLKQGFEEACFNWETVTEPSYIDFEVVEKTITDTQARLKELGIE